MEKESVKECGRKTCWAQMLALLSNNVEGDGVLGYVDDVGETKRRC